MGTYLSRTPYILLEFTSRYALRNRACDLIDIFLERERVDVFKDLLAVVEADGELYAFDESSVALEGGVECFRGF